MDFKIHTHGGGSETHSGEARYSIDDGNGVLTVYTADGTRYRYSPTFWQSVEDRPDQSVPVIEEVRLG